MNAEPAEGYREQEVGLEGADRRKTEVPDEESHEQDQRYAGESPTAPAGHRQQEKTEERAHQVGDQCRGDCSGVPKVGLIERGGHVHADRVGSDRSGGVTECHDVVEPPHAPHEEDSGCGRQPGGAPTGDLGQTDQPDREHEHAQQQGRLLSDVHSRVLGAPADLFGEVVKRRHQQLTDVLGETVGEARGDQADADDDLDASRQRDTVRSSGGEGGRERRR